MAGKPRPKPCFLDRQVRLGSVTGELRWRNADGDRLYTWDSLHGHIEAYDKRGRHLGSLDAITGTFIGKPVKGRRIDV